jgi:uncharacterized protein
MNQISIRQLFTYPIKGLTPQPQKSVYLKQGHGIPGDRAFALMYEDCTNPENSQTNNINIPWMKKQNFAMQNDWAGLAALDCSYNPSRGDLTIKHQQVKLLTANTNTSQGRDLIGSFFTGYLAAISPSKTARHPQKSTLRLVGEYNTTRYPDREAVHISLISQATLNHLTELAGQYIDVRRFRPNIVIDGVEAWEEFNLVGQELQLGSSRIAIASRINRCLNIEVNPETGQRDIPLLSLLQNNFQHVQTGVLATVVVEGEIAIVKQQTNKN